MRVLLSLSTGTWRVPLFQTERAVHRGREFAPGTLLPRLNLTHMASRLRRIHPRNEQAKGRFRPRARTMQSVGCCAMEIVIIFFSLGFQRAVHEEMGGFTGYLSLSMLYTCNTADCIRALRGYCFCSFFPSSGIKVNSQSTAYAYSSAGPSYLSRSTPSQTTHGHVAVVL